MNQEVYIHQLLEPTDIIIVGNAKRYGILELPDRSPVVAVCPEESEPKCYKKNYDEINEELD